MPNHTKGPWRNGRAGNGTNPNHRVLYDQNDDPVATLDNVGLEDAKLIAAAPDLLDAAKTARERLKHVDPFFPNGLSRKLDEAIQKAEGDT